MITIVFESHSTTTDNEAKLVAQCFCPNLSAITYVGGSFCNDIALYYLKLNLRGVVRCIRRSLQRRQGLP